MSNSDAEVRNPEALIVVNQVAYNTTYSHRLPEGW